MMTRHRHVLALALGVFAAACDGARDPNVRTDSTADTSAGERASDRLTAPLPTLDPVVAAFVARVDPALFTRWGACPFECCVYRDWVAEGPVVMHAEPDSGAAVLATIPEGERFLADTGFVRITSPQLVIVTAPVEVYIHAPGDGYGGNRRTLGPGDTLLVLDYLGEGEVMMSTGSELVSAQIFWPVEDQEAYPDAQGRTVGSLDTEWWAHVRTGAGLEGWIDVYASELGNLDACG